MGSPPGYDDICYTASTAFLFSLTNPAGVAPTKYILQDATKIAVCNYQCWGPTFGKYGNGDLCCDFDDGYTSYSAFPQSYVDTTGRGIDTFTGSEGGSFGSAGRKFNIAHMEVWNVLP